MSKITKKDFFVVSDDWSKDEIKTASEIYDRRKDVFERLGSSKRDNVLIASEAQLIIDRHGYNSAIYRDFLEGTKCIAGWSDSNYRMHVFRAGKGYLALPGSDADKDFIWKKNPSLSALGRCEDIPHGQRLEFLKILKAQPKFPVTGSVDYYIGNGELPPTVEERRAYSDLQKRLKAEKEAAKPKSSPLISNQTAPIPTPYVAPVVTPEVVEASYVSIDEIEDILEEPTITNEPINITPMLSDSAVLDRPVTDTGSGSSVLYKAVESFAFEKRKRLSDCEKQDLLRMIQVLKTYCGVSL